MKYISLLLFSVVLCLSTSAQWTRPNVSYGTRSYRLALDSTFLFPTGNGFPTSLKATDLKQAGLQFDSTAGKLRVYNPATATWITLSDSATAAVLLSGYVPSSRTITINGTAQTLGADRSWTTVSSVGAGYGILGGTITSTGTHSVDTFKIATREKVQKPIDSLGAAISIPSNRIAIGTGTGLTSYSNLQYNTTQGIVQNLAATGTNYTRRVNQSVTFTGYAPYDEKFTVNSNGDGTYNTIFSQGFNIHGDFDGTAPGNYRSVEGHWVDGGVTTLENHLVEVYVPGESPSRLASATFHYRGTFALSDNTWDFRGTSFNVKTMGSNIRWLDASYNISSLNAILNFGSPGGVASLKLSTLGSGSSSTSGTVFAAGGTNTNLEFDNSWTDIRLKSAQVSVSTTNPNLLLESNSGSINYVNFFNNGAGTNNSYFGQTYANAPSIFTSLLAGDFFLKTNQAFKLSTDAGSSVTASVNTNGDFYFKRVLLPNGLAGTSGQVLTSQGSSAAPTWTNVGTVTSVGLATGTSGSDVNVSGSPVTSSGTLTLNIPDAGASARGLVTTGTQTFAGAKTFTSPVVISSSSTSVDGLTVSVPNDNPFLASFYNRTYSSSTPVLNYFAFNSGIFAMGTGAAKDFRLYVNNGYNTPAFTLSADGNIGLFGSSFGSGTGVVFLKNASTVPSTTPSGGGVLYTEDGALKYKGSSGTVTTIAVQ